LASFYIYFTFIKELCKHKLVLRRHSFDTFLFYLIKYYSNIFIVFLFNYELEIGFDIYELINPQ